MPIRILTLPANPDNVSSMRGRFAKALFVVALLANLLTGLPVKALAHAMEHPPMGTSHLGMVHDHQHMMAMASDPTCQPQNHASGKTAFDDCCHISLGSPVLSDAVGIAPVDWDKHHHGQPGSDQILASGTILPLLRPPRA